MACCQHSHPVLCLKFCIQGFPCCTVAIASLVTRLFVCTVQVESMAGSLAGALHTAQVAAGSACDAEIQLFQHLVDKAEELLQSPRAGGDGEFCPCICVVLVMGAVICDHAHPQTNSQCL